jgi:hypothetical protein
MRTSVVNRRASEERRSKASEGNLLGAAPGGLKSASDILPA